MARNTDNGISGTIGNLVFYTMNGKNYVRSKPGKRLKKRGQVPNPRQILFGTISRHGSAMGRQMSPNFLFPFGLYAYNRLRGWMHSQFEAMAKSPVWEPGATGNMICGLNPEADLRDFFAVPLSFADNGGGQVNIDIPALNPKKEITAPRNTSKVNMKLVLVSSSFGGANTVHAWTAQYSFDYTDTILPAKTISIHASSASSIAGHIALIAIALEFEIIEKRKRMINTEDRWLPAAVVAMGRLKA